MLGRVIDSQHMVLYRTVLHDRLGYRQGLLIDVQRLIEWLREAALGGDGLRDFATFDFSSPLSGPEPSFADARYVFRHRYAEPFDDLGLTLTLEPLPGLGGASYIYALAGLLLLTGALGLFALHRMVSVAIRFADRRSNFAAAVSHELKTPLTAIRMYAEMLRDGMVESDDEARRVLRGHHRRVRAAEPPDPQRARVLAAGEGDPRDESLLTVAHRWSRSSTRGRRAAAQPTYARLGLRARSLTGRA